MDTETETETTRIELYRLNPGGSTLAGGLRPILRQRRPDATDSVLACPGLCSSTETLYILPAASECPTCTLRCSCPVSRVQRARDPKTAAAPAAYVRGI